MKSVVYHRDAESEYLAAVLWSERERPGRGLRLDALVLKAEQQLLKFPRSGRVFLRGTRRLVLARFPYSLIYLVEADRCTIVAFAHAKKRPGYWKERLG